jgi:hypothetical protein
MALGNVLAQTTRKVPSTPMREMCIAPTLLPVRCVYGLIRDETGSSFDRERWVTPRTYRTTHGVNPTTRALTRTARPTNFTKVLGRVRQYSGSAAASRQYLKCNTVQRREP